jgi:hypothetical protein
MSTTLSANVEQLKTQAADFQNAVAEKTEQFKEGIEDLKDNVNGAIAATKDTIHEVTSHTRRYYRSTLFACGSLFLLNGLLLYFGTLSGSGRIDLARFYGFREGKNEHMQRSMGIFCLILALTNFTPLIFKFEQRAETIFMRFATIVNMITMVHYSLETVLFRGLRIEIVFCMGMFLILNVGWTIKEMFHAKRSNVVVVKETKAPGAVTSVKKIN